MIRQHSFSSFHLQDHTRLVRLYLSLAFSSPTVQGWDPSIKLVGEDPKTRERIYEITVEEKKDDKIALHTYTTVSVLSDVAADSPLGRATRVWLVKDSSGEQRVLKDVWLDTDQLPEVEIRKRILQDVQHGQGEEAVAKLSNFMLTPLAHCKVCVDGVEDHTADVMMRGYDFSRACIIPIRTEQLPADPLSQSVSFATPSDRDVASQSYRSPKSQRPAVSCRPMRPFLDSLKQHARYHDRTVYKEYATPIYNERNLGYVFRCVECIVCGKHIALAVLIVLLLILSLAFVILHMAGWFHCDVSAGNVYWYKSKDGLPRGLLGDLEYARKSDTEISHPMRIVVSDIILLVLDLTIIPLV